MKVRYEQRERYYGGGFKDRPRYSTGKRGKTMTSVEKERQLRKSMYLRRIILAILFLCFLTLAITFSALFNNYKAAIDESNSNPWSYPTYDNTLSVIAAICWMLAFVSGVYLLADFLICRVIAVQKGASSILFAVNPLFASLYIDGEKVDSGYGYRYCLQGVLPDGTKVIVAMSGRWVFANMVFSDNSPDISV